MVWAIGYTVHYHFIADRSQEQALAAEIAAAEARWPREAAASVEFALTPEAISAGEAVFAASCAMCHGPALEGGIGPSFLDAEWIHGGSPEEVIRTITEGVPEKGMLAWGPILGSEQVNLAAAYVLAKNAEALGIPLEEVMGTPDGDPGAEPGEEPGEDATGS